MLFFIVAAGISHFRAQTIPLLTESFNYPNGTALTSANWTNAAGAGTNNISTAAGNLTYSGTIGNGIGNKVSLTNNGQDIYRAFSAATLSTAVPAVYASAVVNVSSAQNVLGAGDYFISLGNTTTAVAKVYIRSSGTAGFNFGIQKSNGTVSYESTVRPYNTNINIVLKYEWVSGNLNDLVKLYVNPTGASEPSTGDIATGTTLDTDITSLGAVQLSQGTALTSPILEVDGINVGTIWASVTSPAYDYGDLPASYDTSKDNVFIPAVHAPLSNLYMGSSAPDLELGPASVAAGADNNGSNGDGADEDAIVPASNPIRNGAIYSISVPVNNPSATARYLYGWIDFDGDGKFEAGEFTNVNIPASAGSTTQTLTWTSAQTSTLASTTKVYMRLRLSTVSLVDNNSDTTLDERSIGNGAISASSSIDAATYATGEVEDYQIDVVDTFDFGDAPTSYDMDRDGTAAANYKPARNLPTSNLYLGSTYTVESAPLSVGAGADNNGSNGDGTSDDGLTASQL
ncbi:GEVED domain-containing protein, partial [uncultured Chryseobacterium sp.]|uniref:GEVED domain-containing protein n=1 Tax=uncultured Chryseobacterium sp. TaxID=259322 RepID=UPI0025F8FB24